MRITATPALPAPLLRAKMVGDDDEEALAESSRCATLNKEVIFSTSSFQEKDQIISIIFH
jgi:hypothetical protein